MVNLSMEFLIVLFNYTCCLFSVFHSVSFVKFFLILAALILSNLVAVNIDDNDTILRTSKAMEIGNVILPFLALAKRSLTYWYYHLSSLDNGVIEL